MIAAAFLLLLYAGVMTGLGPRVLRWITGRGITPRLGVLAWLTAIVGVLGAWIGALVILSVEAIRDGGRGAPDSLFERAGNRQTRWDAPTVGIDRHDRSECGRNRGDNQVW